MRNFVRNKYSFTLSILIKKYLWKKNFAEIASNLLGPKHKSARTVNQNHYFTL